MADSRRLQAKDGTSTSRREYLDFVIDGQSLGEALSTSDIGCLGWGANLDYQYGLLQQLLLDRPSKLETGRRLLYVCPAGGDVGCGAITVAIEEESDCYVWKDFGIELNYYLDDAESLFDLSKHEGIGPFRFDKRQYREALTNWPWCG